MTQNCKVIFGNISKHIVEERVFESKNQAFVWLNHQLVRQAGLDSVHELYFRVESFENESSVFNKDDFSLF